MTRGAVKGETLSLGRRTLTVMAFGVCCTSTYLLINHNPIREPIYLWMTPLDRAIPLMAWTVWPYMALLLSDLVLPLFVKRRRLFVLALWAYAVSMVINALLWLLLPTTFPRPPVPQGDGISDAGYRLLVVADSPLNCFPSGHISVPTVWLWALHHQYPSWRVRGPLYGLFALMFATILTTRQHYILDMLGGMSSAAIGVAVALWWERRRAATGVGV